MLLNFNGVLVQTRPLAVKYYNEIAGEKGYRPIAPDEAESLGGLSIRERCRLLGVPLHRMPLVGMAIKRRYQADLPTLPAVPGMPELLAELKSRGYKLGFLTSNGKEATRAFLRHNRMEPFDYELYAAHPFSKSRDLARFVKSSGTDRARLLYVGDERRDLAAGNRIGIASVGAAWGYDSAGLLRESDPVFVAERPEQLRAFLLDYRFPC
ncbi:HAD hydrolase-like protein [Paenibacillus methanolicus]|uniref:HAD hydrolase-like protein n=1 Tax=Paenibacillus methanolicus TaxID=582686 RepID=UPI001FEB05FE|nr:HAD hydrolase-like protein [Paenibacillus methanolicus]